MRSAGTGQAVTLGVGTLETATLNGLSSSVLLASNYDYNGNRTALSVNIGGTANFTRGEFTGFANGTNDFTNAYTYDALQNMTSVVQTIQATPNNAIKTVDFGYDADSRLTGVAGSYNTTGTNYAVASAAYTYDHDSNMTALTYLPQGNTSATPLATCHWDYDNAAAVDQVLAGEAVTGGTGSVGAVNWLLGDNQRTIRDVAQYTASSNTTSVVNHLVFVLMPWDRGASSSDGTTLGRRS